MAVVRSSPISQRLTSSDWDIERLQEAETRAAAPEQKQQLSSEIVRAREERAEYAEWRQKHLFTSARRDAAQPQRTGVLDEVDARRKEKEEERRREAEAVAERERDEVRRKRDEAKRRRDEEEAEKQRVEDAKKQEEKMKKEDEEREHRRQETERKRRQLEEEEKEREEAKRRREEQRRKLQEEVETEKLKTPEQRRQEREAERLAEQRKREEEEKKREEERKKKEEEKKREEMDKKRQTAQQREQDEERERELARRKREEERTRAELKLRSPLTSPRGETALSPRRASRADLEPPAEAPLSPRRAQKAAEDALASPRRGSRAPEPEAPLSPRRRGQSVAEAEDALEKEFAKMIAAEEAKEQAKLKYMEEEKKRKEKEKEEDMKIQAMQDQKKREEAEKLLEEERRRKETEEKRKKERDVQRLKEEEEEREREAQRRLRDDIKKKREDTGLTSPRSEAPISPRGAPEVTSPRRGSVSRRRVGTVYDERMLLHECKGNPEGPERLRTMLKVLGPLYRSCVHIEPRLATKEEILTVHTVQVYDAVADAQKLAEDVTTTLNPDTYANRHSFEAASLAVGGLLELTGAVARGEVHNGVALIRPPASSNESTGSCLFNNAAIAARYAQKVLGLSKILIVDWDLHHGNGTQEIFYRDPTVLYMSAHRYGTGKGGSSFFPGSGGPKEVGRAQGEGFSVNCGFLADGMGDAEYIALFKHIFVPIARDFQPELVIVSAGFDCSEGEKNAVMKVTPTGFEQMLSALLPLASGKVVLALETGFDPYHTASGVKACIEILQPSSLYEAALSFNGYRDMMSTVDAHRKYWPSIRSIEENPEWTALAKPHLTKLDAYKKAMGNSSY